MLDMMVVTGPVGRVPSDEELERERREQARRVLATATVSPLWPTSCVGAPQLSGWSGHDRASGLTLIDGTTVVEVEAGREFGLPPEARVRDALEMRLEPTLGRRPAAAAVVQTELRGLPATIDGRPAESVSVHRSPGAR